MILLITACNKNNLSQSENETFFTNNGAVISCCFRDAPKLSKRHYNTSLSWEAYILLISPFLRQSLPRINPSLAALLGLAMQFMHFLFAVVGA